MALPATRGTRVRKAIWPALGALLLCYFCYHMVNGDHGVLAYLQLHAKVAEAETVAARLAARHAELAARVALLTPDALDPDMLEEQARRQLNYARDDELLILDLAVRATFDAD